MKCEICGKECSSNRGLGCHIVQAHNIDTKSYYDTYRKSPKEGVCCVCGKPTVFRNLTRGYRKHCSQACVQIDPAVKEKQKQTNLEKYGAENVFASDYGKQKLKETNRKRYGVEHSTQNKEILAKAQQTQRKNHGGKLAFNTDKQRETVLMKYGGVGLASKAIKNKAHKTNLERYGYKSPMKNKEVQYKKEQTNLDRYGVASPLASQELREKGKHTSLTKYGTEYPNQSEVVREKIRQTNLVKYDAENPAQSQEVQDKMKQTNLQRYGVENPYASKTVIEKRKKHNLKTYGVEYVSQSEEFKKRMLESRFRTNNLDNELGDADE